jgi:hypothetical protein
MLYRRLRNRLRVPHQLAAVSALVLLITAWTGKAENPVEALHASPQANDLSVDSARLPDEEDSGSLADAKAGVRISLMLFRFN